MRHYLFGWLVFTLCFAGLPDATSSFAQEAGPIEGENVPNNDQGAAEAEAPAAGNGFLGRVARFQPGWSLLIKLILFGVLFMAWVGTADWVNRDAQVFGLGHRKWNPIIFFPFAVLAFFSFLLPLNFWILLPVLLVVYLATTIPYVVVHNKAVEPHQTVLTTSWFRYAAAAVLANVGIKVATERKAEYEKGAAVDLIAMGGEDANADNVNLLTARQSPGYLLVKDLIAEMVDRRSERARLSFTAQAVDVRHQIDGVWHPAEAKDRASGDVLLAVTKTLCNMDAKERRKKQVGRFGAKYQGKTLLLPVVSEGVKSGERVIITSLQEKAAPKDYNDLGMREGLQQTWSEMMGLDQGLLVLSTLPGDGLTTITDVSLNETDRLMRDFAAIEEVNHREHDLQNVGVTTYDASKGQTPVDILPDLIRTYPNVYVLREFDNPEAAKLLLDEIGDERLVITSVQARNAAEALLRMLQMKVPHKQFAQWVTGVLYQRLVRKLCDDCKVGYQPSPDALKKLGIPPNKVSELYRTPKPEEVEEGKPCPTCRGIGYHGRTGIFELLKINDQMREILLKQPKIELLKKAARASGQRSLQEEGVLLVAKGVTSLPELQRVLKAGA